ncbi:MAG: 4'-phosphopantetheinyl transferase superfamily protein [Desulfatibacillum sp.]|nr:4'-phosphopantetheinyl transferase superfamily protein [Desulfatibacillum sp.]
MNDLPLLKLAPGQVHVWFTCPEEIRDPDLLVSYHSLLTPDEQEKQVRYIMPWHRHSSLITRAVARCVLSRYSSTKPHEWRFRRNMHGKPEIVQDSQSPPLHFNLAHTHGLIACAVALEHPVGVDVERWDRQRDFERLATRYFSTDESTMLTQVPEYAQRRLFFNIWTLKESYIKAKGMGLSMGLDKFSFVVSENGNPRIVLDPDLKDDPAAWAFRLLTPTKFHVAALALHRAPGTACQVQSRFIIPLVHEELTN